MGKFPLTIFQFPAFLGIGSLCFADFWHKGAKWQCHKSDRARSSKKIFWPNLGQKLLKNRVFWTMCKIASLVFSDFWQKDRLQVPKNMAEKNFPGKFFFVVNYGFSFLGEIPFDHFFLVPAFLGIGSLVFSDFWNKGAK